MSRAKSGEEKTGDNPTMADLAKVAGVSAITVSRALRDSPLVNPETRARIREAAAIPRDHFDIGEQMVAERDRLRRLQMREARHEGRRMSFRLLR